MNLYYSLPLNRLIDRPNGLLVHRDLLGNLQNLQLNHIHNSDTFFLSHSQSH